MHQRPKKPKKKFCDDKQKEDFISPKKSHKCGQQRCILQISFSWLLKTLDVSTKNIKITEYHASNICSTNCLQLEKPDNLLLASK